MANKTSPSADSSSDERTATTAANSNLEQKPTRSETSIHRRSYLKLLGVSAVPLAAGRAQAAETGYGAGGYGEGGYGGVEDGTDDPEEPVAPTVVTDSATDITDSSATLQGSVTDLGDAEAVDGSFEVREVDSSGWSTTEARRLTAEGSYSVTVEDLSSDTDYEYRAVAASDDATAIGETVSFVTDVDEIGEPVIEGLDLADTSGPNPHVDLEVNWSVSHPDDALEAVWLTIRDATGGLVNSSTIAVDGSRGSGSETFRIQHGAGDSYLVTLTVCDQAGNTTSEDATIET